MNRIFVAGDFHGEIDMYDTLTDNNFPQQYELTKEDYLIQLGDFGVVWNNTPTVKEDDMIKWLSDKPFTTIVVLGNHENYDRITVLPTVEKFGGKVWQLSESIFILRRGRVYTIGGKTFFTMGGAKSVDKPMRVEGRSWWSKEIPSNGEFLNGLAVLDSRDWSVDYVVTHTLPRRIINEYMNSLRDKYFEEMGSPTGYYDRIADQFIDTEMFDEKKDAVAYYLEMVFFEYNLQFKKHFAGHFHENWTSKNGKHNIVYRSVLEITDESEG